MDDRMSALQSAGRLAIGASELEYRMIGPHPDAAPTIILLHEGLGSVAPHFVVEDISVTSISELETVYEQGDLKAKLARWHDDVDNAFYGWNGAWLDPKFRDWDISDYLAYVRVPVQIVQGADDHYGTM